MTTTPRVLILAGPTAAGKTALGVAVARRIGAEILSADSRQIYRQLTIGAAKPSEAEQGGVRHHFIDELDLDAPFSAGMFARAAAARIAAIHARGGRALVVGGSTLYLHALQYGLADIPEAPAQVRAGLMERLGREGLPALYAELERVDPALAAATPPANTQRVVRALEVYHATGRPLSSFRPGAPHPPAGRFATVVLALERSRLYERINRRVVEMIDRGLIAEVEGIRAAGYPESLNALQTIGYRETFAHLRGAFDRAELVRRIQMNTRRYAKRQLTWHRRFPEYTWLDAAEADPDQLAAVALGP